MVNNAMLVVAQLMELSGRTAPKGGGKDYVVQKTITGKQLGTLAGAMEKIASESKNNEKASIGRDGGGIRNSEALVLIGLKNAKPSKLNCGACGFKTCGECVSKIHPGVEFTGPICAMRLIDLGVALGSAVKTASMLNADNRMMYSAGMAAVKTGLIDADIAIGIPISGAGKNIYFDRR